MDFCGYFFREEFQDKELFSAIEKEFNRQRTQIELIASENFVSKEVLAAIGCVMTNKYAEGYPGKRFHENSGRIAQIYFRCSDRNCLG